MSPTWFVLRKKTETRLPPLTAVSKVIRALKAEWFPSSGAEIRRRGKSFPVVPIHHPAVSRATLEGFALPAVGFIVIGLEN